MAYVFEPAKQASITFNEAGTANTRKINFFTANDSLTPTAATMAANELFGVGGIIVATPGAVKTEKEAVVDNG